MAVSVFYLFKVGIGANAGLAGRATTLNGINELET